MRRGGKGLVRMRVVFWKTSVAWQIWVGRGEISRTVTIESRRKERKLLLTFPILVHFQYRGYFKITTMLDSGVYNISQISRSCPISLKLIIGEAIAPQSFSFSTSLLPISTFKAFNAPAAVCFRAKSALRASVDASRSIMRPSG